MLLVVVLVGLATGFAVSTVAQQKDTVDPKIEQQIRALASKYDDAFNRNDAPAVTALYKEDGVRAFNGISHGRQAIEKSYAQYFKRWYPHQPLHHGHSYKRGRQ
jgi:ketosteroid isomerase-like protein